MVNANQSNSLTTMWDILQRYTLTNRVFCSSDYDVIIDRLAAELGARVHTFTAADERNGWVIPPRWDPVRATISRDGTVCYNALDHPLGLIAMSRSFTGRVSREELRAHLHVDRRYPEALPYHFRQMYRPWDRDWGFCVPQFFYDTLPDLDHDVNIEIQEGPGILRILDACVPGRRPETILLAAHLDHPGMANDDLAGCAVGVALMQWLATRQLKFTYRLILHQEVIGAEYFLASLPAAERALIVDGIFLEMLGTESELGLQKSLSGSDLLLERMRSHCRENGIEHRDGDYGDIVVNGEYVWESHGVALASFSRFPYPEYHSSRDNLSIISPRALSESLEILKAGIMRLEAEPVLFKDFVGTLALANPYYDLYVDTGQTGLGREPAPAESGLRLAMELLPTLKGPAPVADLASRWGLPLGSLLEYLRLWECKGLVEIY